MKLQKKITPWLKESSRDILAFGGLAFGLALVARSTLGGYYGFVYQVVFSFILLFGLGFLTKNFQKHIARALVLLVFTVLFYSQDPDILFFAMFLAILFVLMVASAIYLGNDKKQIFFGFIFGLFVTIISYYLAMPLAEFLGLPI